MRFKINIFYAKFLFGMVMTDIDKLQILKTDMINGRN